MNYLKQNNIDALLLKSNANIIYTAKIDINHYELEGFALVCEDFTHIITDGRYEVEGQKICSEHKNIKLHIIKGVNYYQLLKQIIKENNLKRIGFEESFLTLQDYNLLNDESYKLVATNNIIENLRKVKTEEEIKIIKEAYVITNKLWDHIKKFVKVNMKESDIVLEMYNFILKNGGTGFSFNPIIASGLNSTKPHAGWTDKVIEDGDVITLDFGIKYKNYCTDVTKNIAVGNVDEKLLLAYDLCYQTNQKATTLIKEGASTAEIDLISRKIIEDAGFGEYYNHSLGHGIGLQIHEQPALSSKRNSILKAGEIVTIEPGIYLPNIGGIRVESAGIVTKEGVEILTSSRKLVKI